MLKIDINSRLSQSLTKFDSRLSKKIYDLNFKFWQLTHVSTVVFCSKDNQSSTHVAKAKNNHIIKTQSTLFYANPKKNAQNNELLWFLVVKKLQNDLSYISPNPSLLQTLNSPKPNALVSYVIQM